MVNYVVKAEARDYQRVEINIDSLKKITIETLNGDEILEKLRNKDDLFSLISARTRKIYGSRRVEKTGDICIDDIIMQSLNEAGDYAKKFGVKEVLLDNLKIEGYGNNNFKVSLDTYLLIDEKR